jgi:murein L,D-transpeptidase YafK
VILRLLSLPLLWSGLALGPAVAATEAFNPETALQRAVEALREGQRQRALDELQALTVREPTFRIAHWLYGDLLALRAGRPIQVPLRDTDLDTLTSLNDEIALRLAADATAPMPGMVPNAVMTLAERHRHVVVVDLARARLFVMENRGGELVLLRRHYASIGRNGSRKEVEGDLRTPVGIYHITQWLPDGQLPELYGAGAFPVSYPNAWDRFKGRTGYGIWLHGVPRTTYARAPRSSEGCVTMANLDLEALRQEVEIGQTPVIFSDELEWVSAETAAAERLAWQARIEGWRSRWSAVDTEAYLDHYHPEFTTTGMDLAKFAAHKRRVNQGKTFIDVQLSDLNLWRYPGTDEPMVLAEFTQHYRSSNFASSTQKQQFWRQGVDGQWRIFREVNR